MTTEVISTVGQTSRQLIRRLSSSRGRNRVHRVVVGVNTRELGLCGYLRNLEKCMVHQIFWRLCGGDSIRWIGTWEYSGGRLLFRGFKRYYFFYFFLLLLAPPFLVGIYKEILWKLLAKENSEKQALQTFILDR